MNQVQIDAAAAKRPSLLPLVAIAGGALVSIALGAYGKLHDPAGRNTITLFFKDTLSFKSWTTTIVFVLALFQVVSAARIYGRLKVPTRLPSWFGDLHRLTGTLAFVLTLPVMFHCLWSLGFSDRSPRRLVHSIAGCIFFGLFACKVFAVRSRKLPGWVLPVVGSATFAVIAVLWATSSLWFFTEVGFPQG